MRRTPSPSRCVACSASFGSAGSDALQCYMHLTADFGASGCPGTFHLFSVRRGVVQMARAEQVLTLPMAVYVDDNMLMGSDRARVDAEPQGSI